MHFSVYRALDDDGEELEASEEDSMRFRAARPGDVLLCPFECDHCQFHKLAHREPDINRDRDVRLLAYIRRALLDAFWAREPGTVAQTLSGTRRLIATQREFGIVTLPALGPWPADYDHGMAVAVSVLLESQQPGIHEATKKYSSFRKIRSAFSNVWGASAQGAESGLVWETDYKRRTVASTKPTWSEWYTRFSTGILHRLGNRPKQDAAISIDVMLEMMRRFDASYEDTGIDPAARLRISQTATYAVLTYCASLRGYETPKIILTYLREFRCPDGRGPLPPHLGLPLAGRFKLRGNMEQNLLLFIVAETQSGLKPLLWVDRLIGEMESRGRTTGWLFADEEGNQLRMTTFEEDIMGTLEDIQATPGLDLIPDGIDIRDAYGLARSFRRGATTRAENKGVPEPLIDYFNRWKESKDGDGPYFRGGMRVHYAEQREMAEKFLKFSAPL